MTGFRRRQQTIDFDCGLPRDVPSGAQIDDTPAVRSNAPPVEPAKLAEGDLDGS
jgi:hypothetical protein